MIVVAELVCLFRHQVSRPLAGVSPRLLLVSLFVVLWCTSCTGLDAGSPENGPRPIVAVGDVHGDYDNFLRVLQQAGVIDQRGNWAAGNTQLVQLGDVPDRGPDTHRVIELLQRLEDQAGRQGGAVHVLIGNHEAMNMLGDLRYVHPGEYAALASDNADQLRQRYFELVVQRRRQQDPEFEATAEYRRQWEQRFPPGYVEHRLTWAPDGDYGSWVLEHDAVLKLGRTLFVHGGIGPDVLGRSIEELNSGIREELSLGEAGPPLEDGLATSVGGPLWYRGLAMNEEAAESDHLEAVLAFYGVDRVVIGHTPLLGVILPRFDGRVLVIDSGISSYYGGHLASLRIEGEQLFSIQRGERLRIPVGDQELIPYFEQLVTLKPDHQALEAYLMQLQDRRP